MDPRQKFVVIDHTDLITKDIDLKEVRLNSAFESDIKLEASGYPEVQVSYLKGRWFIPVESKYATWLLLQYPTLLVREVDITIS